MRKKVKLIQKIVSDKKKNYIAYSCQAHIVNFVKVAAFVVCFSFSLSQKVLLHCEGVMHYSNGKGDKMEDL